MILMRVKDYIQKRRQVSLPELAREFEMAPSAMQGMLTIWEKKKVIASSCQKPCNKACSKACQPIAYYHYIS